MPMPERTGKRPGRRIAVIPWLVILSLFVVELFFYTWCGVQSMKVSYEISNAMDRHNELAMLEKSLTIELAYLRSPQSLSELTQKQFKLQMPTREQVIMLP